MSTIGKNKKGHLKKAQRITTSFPGLSARQRAFLAAFMEMPVVLWSARAARVQRKRHYVWLRGSEAYRAAFAVVEEMAVQMLEDEAVSRARDGWLEPVYQGGKKVGHVRRYSDVLLIFLLKALMADKYRERSTVDVRGKVAVDVRERIDSGRKRLAVRGAAK